MDAVNLVVLRGTVTRTPTSRTLPSGSTVVQLEVATRGPSGTTTVPVAVHDRPVRVAAGDEIVVVGQVARRFFRAGGATQSRTEVIATALVRASRTTTVARLLAGAIGLLEP